MKKHLTDTERLALKGRALDIGDRIAFITDKGAEALVDFAWGNRSREEVIQILRKVRTDFASVGDDFTTNFQKLNDAIQDLKDMPMEISKKRRKHGD